MSLSVALLGLLVWFAVSIVAAIVLGVAIRKTGVDSQEDFPTTRPTPVDPVGPAPRDARLSSWSGR
jgi:hypothetical protein